jgi:hypothetical protein
MPVRDRVLGAHLDTRGVAAGDLERASTLFEQATANDDQSASDRRRELELLRLIPGVAAEVALEDEEGGRALLVLDRGGWFQTSLADSRARDQLEPPRGEPHAVVHPGKGVSIDDQAAQTADGWVLEWTSPKVNGEGNEVPGAVVYAYQVRRKLDGKPYTCYGVVDAPAEYATVETSCASLRAR